MINNLSNDKKPTENIKVIVRIRPKIDREYDQNTNSIYCEDNAIFIQTKKEKKQFTFDYVASEETSQSEIFSHCGKEICDSVLEGYNGTIFVYGQTGAGKTYTLLGPKFTQSTNFSTENTPLQTSPLLKRGYLTYTLRKEEEGRGILPRVIEYLFTQSKNLSDSNVTFTCSFLEIYKEQISDLLDINSNKNIAIRDLSDSVIVENLAKLPIASPEEAYSLIKEGSKSRHIAATNMNKESSRSHTVFSIYITNKTVSSTTGKTVIKKSVFHLIDLAGSERQKSTQCVGERIKEAGMINKSLMQLSHVIKNLSEINTKNKNLHIHYRDSKLTHLLKDSLGGNAKTCIIANISPANGSIQETISTLIFAQSAKMIKNKAIVNEEYANSLISGGPISAKASFEEVKKLREKYNAVKAENFYLLSLLEGSDYKGYNQFGMNSKGNNEFTKTIDCVEEEIENMLNEISNKEAAMNELINKKERMKKQYDDIEIELKIKDKMLQEKKSVLNLNKKEYDVVKNQLKKNVLENAYQTKSLNTFEKDKIKLSEEHKEKLNELNKVITGQNNLIITKNNIIKSTLEDISEISEVIESQTGVIRTKTLQEEKIIKEKGELDKEIERQEEDINRLNSEISEISAELSKLNDVLANTKNELIEAKQKCKTFINDLSGKIQLLQLKRIEVEEKKNAALKEVEYSNLEFEKLQQGIEERKNQIQVINVGKIKHLEEEKENRLEEKREAETKLKAAKERNIKLNDEFDVLSENKNIYSNKISLLTKLKNENTKLRNELIQYKSKVDDLKIRFNAKGTQIDIASLTTQKENQLKESERMILKVINRMKNEYNKRNNYATENLFDEEHRDLKDTFNYYFEKVLDIKKENELILKQKEEENQKADKQIASLNRELQNLKEAGSNKCSIEVKVSRRTLSRIDTNIISPFGKKRKFNEFMPINGDSL